MPSPACRTLHAPVGEPSLHSHGPGGGSCSNSTDLEAPIAARPPRAKQQKALAWCIGLTLVTMIAEIVGGLVSGSLMLLSDAAHMLSHLVALSVSWFAIRMGSRPRTARSHYGLYRAEILASFINAVGLLVLSGWIVFESIERFQSPVEVQGKAMIAVAILGLVVNLITAKILSDAGAEDLNTKSALLHMLGDLFSSVVIVVGGLVLLQTGWNWIDPALSIAVALVILWWGIGLLRSSTSILLERAPECLEPAEVQRTLEAHEGVHEVHDLHVWEITSGYICLTAHVVLQQDARLSESMAVRDELNDLLWSRYRVAHVTLQLEAEGAPAGASSALA